MLIDIVRFSFNKKKNCVGQISYDMQDWIEKFAFGTAFFPIIKSLFWFNK